MTESHSLEGNGLASPQLRDVCPSPTCDAGVVNCCKKLDIADRKISLKPVADFSGQSPKE